jgi:glycosyltransferase involved in cell wall biosynthesis
MAWVIKSMTSAKYLFDMRGFWADERVDGGLWPHSGRMYRVAKWFEKRFFLSADHVVSLTHAAVCEMQRFDYLQGRMPPVTVIPTCADLTRFTPTLRERDGGGFVLGYVGSAGTWYLFDAVASCFSQLLRMQPNAQFLIINRGQHVFIRSELAKAGVPDAAFEIVAADHGAVPDKMAKMDAGIFFYRPSFSRAACAPTKLGEFLGCGIPCLGTAVVGEMAEELEGEQVGVVLKSFDEASLVRGLDQLLTLAADPSTAVRCMAAAQKHFSLETGVQRYADIYCELLRENKV